MLNTCFLKYIITNKIAHRFFKKFLCDNLPVALSFLNWLQAASERNWALRTYGRLTTGFDVTSWIATSNAPYPTLGFPRLLQETFRSAFEKLQLKYSELCNLPIGIKCLLKFLRGNPYILSLSISFKLVTISQPPTTLLLVSPERHHRKPYFTWN